MNGLIFFKILYQMDLNIGLNFSDCEIFFKSQNIILKWKDESAVQFKIRDQINVTIKYNNLEFEIKINTNDIAEDFIRFESSRTFVNFDDHARFFFNTERHNKNKGKESPKTKFYNNYRSYYNITEFGLKFRDIMSFMSFLKIGENNWKNHDYFFFLWEHQEREEENKLRRVNSF
jgi:hypothetical protein